MSKEILGPGLNVDKRAAGKTLGSISGSNTFSKDPDWLCEQWRSVFWHTSAHLLAYALHELYPGIKFGTGPAIENGFYYDVDFGDRSFSQADFPRVEKKMLELASQGYAMVRREVSKQAAMAFFNARGQSYKLEILQGLNDGTITLYETGDYTDLCAGPHLTGTLPVRVVTLTGLARAYWRGDEHNKMLTRVYGITFPSQEQLTGYLQAREQASKRDHRKIGAALDLFYLDDQVGLGLPLWTPRGESLRQNLIGFLKKLQRRAGYEHVASPHIGRKDLYVTSGHFAKYGQDAFQPIRTPQAGEEFFLKPMNCPHHCRIYAAKPRSYRDLPVKYAEFGTVYRYEQHGELHGLTRVRGFTQDDAHIFCRPDQLKEEFLKVIDLVNLVYTKLGITDFRTQISLRDPVQKDKYLGSDELWELAEQAIMDATMQKGMLTTTVEGEAAFYGPKLDFIVRDAIGRKWQVGTIQVDYMMPENFDLVYTCKENSRQRPVMIHRALFGSLERFIALLIEQTEGRFPLWLAPEKVRVLPVSVAFENYARQVAGIIEKAFDYDWTVAVDSSSERIAKKVRMAEQQKTPYILIVGQREQDNQTVSVRSANDRLEIHGPMLLKDFIDLLNVQLNSVL